MEYEDQLNDISKHIEENTLPTLMTNMRQLEEIMGLHENIFEGIAKTVNIFREELKTVVDNKCDQLLFGLTETESKNMSDIRAVISDLERQIHETMTFVSMCDEKLRKGDLDPIPFALRSYKSNISLKMPIFVPGQDLPNDMTRNILGSIKWKAEEIFQTKPENPIASILPMFSYISEPMKQIIDIKTSDSFQAVLNGSSVVPVGKDTAWIANWLSATMCMYDTKGNEINSITVRGLCYIWDLAVKQSGDIIVCNGYAKVMQVSMNGKVTTLIDTAPYSPQGVCLTKKDEIVVCMAYLGGDNHVAVYSPDGKKIIREIEVKDDKGKQLLTDPTRVVVNDEYISVMNNMSNVVTSDQDGTVKWVYDGSQTESGKLCAMGMCINKSGNLLISDYHNHCVHFLDREGCLIQILLTRDTHGVERPCGIGVDDDSGKVWVGHGNDKVSIFTYLEN